MPQRIALGEEAAAAAPRSAKPAPVEVIAPARQTLPLVVASPHSGDIYPPAFVAQSRLDPLMLRRSEDAYVHELCAAAPSLGAPLLRATFPRAYLDPNREPYELDPAMFDGPLPRWANTRSPRVLAGLGTIARLVANGADIYDGKLPVEEVEHRIATCYRPYHETLSGLIDATRDLFGYCILLDCHSMPSGAAGSSGQGGQAPSSAEFVLGDCHGVACSKVLVHAVQEALSARGYVVARNAPYAGGFTTRHYGRPADGLHALQIEINRRLYMNERTMERTRGFSGVADVMSDIFAAIGGIPAEAFRSA